MSDTQPSLTRSDEHPGPDDALYPDGRHPPAATVEEGSHSLVGDIGVGEWRNRRNSIR